MQNTLEELKYALNIMHDQVKYAENKNSALIVLNAGLVFGIVSNFDTFKKMFDFNIFEFSVYYTDNQYKAAIFGILICLLSSMIISLISFIPQVTQNILEKQTSRNIFLFSSNSTFKSSLLLKNEYTKKYRVQSKYESDIYNQILNLSRIADRKYKLFKIAIYPIIISPVMLIISLIFIK